jgi:prophage antirepressor-like protein
MSEIVPFDYNGSEVRTLLIGGEPWFVAKDVCDRLEVRNASQALSYLDDDEKSQVDGGVISNDPRVQAGAYAIINEPGLYSLTLRSRKPGARAFKRWVTHEVLPALRKRGAYAVPGASQAARPTGLLVAQYEERAYRRRSRELAAQGLYENRLTGEVALRPDAPQASVLAMTDAEVAAFRKRLAIPSMSDEDVIALAARLREAERKARRCAARGDETPSELGRYRALQ